MADGKTHYKHAKRALLVTVGLSCAASVAMPLIVPFSLAVCSGAWIGCYDTPDMDLAENTKAPWWTPRRWYGEKFTHRGVSHYPFVGTLTRYPISFGPVVLILFGLAFFGFFAWWMFFQGAAGFYVGMLIPDAVHRMLDGYTPFSSKYKRKRG